MWPAAVVIVVLGGLTACGSGDSLPRSSAALGSTSPAPLSATARPSVSVTGARVVDEVTTGNRFGGKTAFTTIPAYGFLLVDVTVEDLGAKLEVPSSKMAVVLPSGSIAVATGLAGEKGCVRCRVTSTSHGGKVSETYVFVVPKDEAEGSFELRFKDAPGVMFTVRQTVPSSGPSAEPT